MTLATWARDIAANYRGAEFSTSDEKKQNLRRSIEFDDLAYRLELKDLRDS